MKLTLRLAAPTTQNGAAQNGQVRTLAEGRLSIGRGPDNDWVLADPDRTLSKNHCRIDGSESGFMLTDLSTNGVFLAGQSQAIGRGHSCALENGDSFTLGPYVISAVIEGEDAGALRLEHGLGLPADDEEAIFSSGDRLGGTRPNGGRQAGDRPGADLLSPIAPAIAEPWLTDIPGGAFGPGRRAAPQGWDAPPDPATYAASGAFEARDPLDPRLPEAFVPHDGFSQSSEHLAAASTVMRVPQPQIVLPTDWNEVPAGDPAAGEFGVGEASLRDVGASEPAGERPGRTLGKRAEPAQAAPAWPPLLPTEPEPAPAPQLPPAWLAAAPEGGWETPEPPAPLPASWTSPVAEPDLATLSRQTPLLEKVADTRISPPPAAPAFQPPPPPRPAMPEPPAAMLSPAVISHAIAPQAAVPASVPPPPSDIVDAAPVSAGEAAGQLVAAFLEGAGLSPDTLRGADTEASFREIGRMVRAAVDGVRDILATRALVKSEFRVEQTVLRRSDNNAMKFAPDAERCLAAMVGAAPPGFLPGAAAMQQSMDDIKRHELALVAAINTVFADLGRQLDPELIMAKAKQETGLGTMLPYAKEVRCWTIYTETHALLQDSGASNTGGSLLAPVAQAYDRQLRRGG